MIDGDGMRKSTICKSIRCEVRLTQNFSLARNINQAFTPTVTQTLRTMEAIFASLVSGTFNVVIFAVST